MVPINSYAGKAGKPAHTPVCLVVGGDTNDDTNSVRIYLDEARTSGSL